jgi:hypothetical protein
LLTNGIIWKVYRIKFGQPIDWEEVYCFDMGALSTRSADDMAKLYMLCRESLSSDALEAFHRQAQIFNRYMLAELLMGDGTVGLLKRELRRLFDLKATDEEVRIMLANDVIKRDAVDGDPPKAAKAMVKKANAALAKKAAVKAA